MTKKAMIQELESKVRAAEKALESAQKEKDELNSRLKAATEKITELQAKLEDADLNALKEKAKKSEVEFEGLKELYAGKIKEFDDSRESREEDFARESAIKRHDLSEEIRINREENQERVSSTVKVFAGSYLYYMDQIRMMMDALSQAAAETGKTLFEGGADDVKERFGASIAEHLRNDVDALEQSNGDRVLIGAAEEPEKEFPAEECCEEPAEACEACEAEPDDCAAAEPEA